MTFKEKWLRRFTFVKWDRFISLGLYEYHYGWIDRDDEYKDFLLIQFARDFPIFWISSSVKYHNDIGKILDHLNTDIKCKKIKDHFNIT